MVQVEVTKVCGSVSGGRASVTFGSLDDILCKRRLPVANIA